MRSTELTLVLDGESLTVEQALRVLQTESISAILAPQVRARMAATRQGAVRALAGGQRVYGWNQALGHHKDTRLTRAEQTQFQRYILLSHAAGVGPTMPDRITRLALVVKANQMAKGTTGVRPELPERLLALVNAGITPCMPQIGSLGVGDLQPQAAAGLVAIGESVPARYRGREMLAPEALTAAGLPVSFELKAGEALPIVSGSTVIAALHLDAIRRAGMLADVAEGALALFMEATRAEASSLDRRTHAERNIPEENDVATRLRALTYGSCWMCDAGRKRLGEENARVQDALSVRAAPHVMGALRQTLAEARLMLEREANASTSNPLVFPRDDENGYEFVMGGNWCGAGMGHAADTLNANLTDLAVLAQELSARLLCPKWSYGLPSGLTGGRIGLNSGMTHVQTVATALIPEMQIRAAPSSVLSRPAKFSQEDHNPMGMASMRNLGENLDRLEIVLGVLVLMSAQGIGLIVKKMCGLPLGAGTQLLYDKVRQHIPLLEGDQYMTPYLEAAIRLVQGGELPAVVHPVHSRAPQAALSQEGRSILIA